MPIEYIAHPIEANINDVTGFRALGVLYTNNTLRPLQVVISTTHQVLVLGVPLLVQLNIDAVGTAWGGWFVTPAIGNTKYSLIVGNIRPGGTYQLNQNAAGGVNTIITWIEVNQ